MSAEPSAVAVELNYFIPPADGSKAFNNTTSDPVTGVPATNTKREWRPVEIENLRGHENDVSLDNSGFQFFHHPSKHTSFDGAEKVKAEYYPESIELIKQLTGASRVVIFDHTIRRRRPGETEDTPDKRQPAQSVHVDQTTAASIARVHRHLPASDVPSLLTKRFQIINLWRPIHHAAYDFPLALCDYRSVNPAQDLIPVTLVYPDHEGETFGVKYNPAHKWKYLREMTPEEGLLIKCFDSIQDGSVAVLTPHTAFEDPTTPPDALKRESIELRALVFYD
ncbi:hypothetical protein EWM64_g3374 [Hericium alpestre]|uniref:Methyltransferase n=1 Tax=Hericium alpestre TaxID=135208 RepID=A0A4Z0A2V6_9AGAM|nr:hypothetical protein EWM64_g3374 [Hericium alpestre]